MQKRLRDITWFPNAWIRLRAYDHIIYFDPAYLTTYFDGYADKTEFSKWPDPIDGLPDGLEKADYIFVTHHHKDHCKNVTVKRLRTRRTRMYAPTSCKEELGDTFIYVRPGDIHELRDNVSLRVVNAYNTPDGTSTKKQHKQGKGVGYILTLHNLTVYHMGDTDFLSEMTALSGIDIAFVPTGGTFTMNIKEAIEATKAIHPRVAVPIHNLGQDMRGFADGLRRSRIRCMIPSIGQVMQI